MAAPDTHVRVSGTWKKVNKVHTKVSGVWKPCKAIWVRQSGVWKKTYSATIPIAISSNQTNLNLFTLAGSPVQSGNYVFTIGSGIYVSSNSTGTAALTVGSFPAGSTVTIVNNGIIVGMGGAGGAGGGTYGYGYSGQNGFAGGNAVSLSFNVIIDNTNGLILGGGGGGGGGVSATAESSKFSAGGGGGGGQSSLTNSAGGIGRSYPGFWNVSSPGGSGTYNAPGSGGNGTTAYRGTQGLPGASGGAHGASGGNAAAGAYTPGSGGAAGRAISLNGFSVTWLGGNDASRVKGSVV